MSPKTVSKKDVSAFPKFPKPYTAGCLAGMHSEVAVTIWKKEMNEALEYRLNHESDKLRLPSMIYQELQLALGLNPKLQKLIDESVRIK